MSLPLPLDGLKSPSAISLGPDAVHLRGFAECVVPELLVEVVRVESASPFRSMVTPGGYSMSVSMTNCGELGWITDESGYRYTEIDPKTAQRWPKMPQIFRNLAADAANVAGFANFMPDACLINRYVPGARMSLHQDKDERDFEQPIVSVSLGLPAVFLWGGRKRADRPQPVLLESGDVVVWGGKSRLIYHGIKKLPAGHHPLTAGARFNLTFRRAR